VTLELASLANVEFKYVCDLEASRASDAARALEKTQGKLPHTTHDMRAVFDDKDVHGVVVATPNSGTRWPRSGPARPGRMCMSRSASRERRGRPQDGPRARKYQRMCRPVRSIAARLI